MTNNYIPKHLWQRQMIIVTVDKWNYFYRTWNYRLPKTRWQFSHSYEWDGSVLMNPFLSSATKKAFFGSRLLYFTISAMIMINDRVRLSLSPLSLILTVAGCWWTQYRVRVKYYICHTNTLVFFVSTKKIISRELLITVLLKA